MVRSPTDHNLVEIPNSENDRVAKSLHVCEFLPSVVVEIGLRSVGLINICAKVASLVNFTEALTKIS